VEQIVRETFIQHRLDEKFSGMESGVKGGLVEHRDGE